MPPGVAGPSGRRRRRERPAEVGADEVDPSRAVGLRGRIAGRRERLHRVAQLPAGPGQAGPGPQPLAHLGPQGRRRGPRDRLQRRLDLVDAIQRRQPARLVLGAGIGLQLLEQGVEQAIPPVGIRLGPGPRPRPCLPDRVDRPLDADVGGGRGAACPAASRTAEPMLPEIPRTISHLAPRMPLLRRRAVARSPSSILLSVVRSRPHADTEKPSRKRPRLIFPITPTISSPRADSSTRIGNDREAEQGPDKPRMLARAVSRAGSGRDGGDRGPGPIGPVCSDPSRTRPSSRR